MIDATKRVWAFVLRFIAGAWRVVLRLARAARALGLRIWKAAIAPLPQAPFVLLVNRRVHRNHQGEVERAEETVAQTEQIEIDAAIALWQFETDRFNGLAAKGAAVLAADAIVATGLATQTGTKGVPAYICIAALVYLASATAAVFAVQRPMPRRVAQPNDVLEGKAAAAMVESVIANQRDGIKLQNLVYVGVRDTAISLALLLAALGYRFAC